MAKKLSEGQISKLVRISQKMKGLGVLLSEQSVGDRLFADENSQEGIGLLLIDLSTEIVDIIEK
jgi:hypothetical protein